MTTTINLVTLMTDTIIPDAKAAAEIASLPPAIAARILTSQAKHWWWDRTLSCFKYCTRVSPGCANCWMIAYVDTRLSSRVGGSYEGISGPTFFPEVLSEFARDLQPKRIFTPSMSDPFHEAFTDEQIFAFFDAMAAAPWHLYYVLTKRADRLAKLGPYLPWGEHVIAIVSVETEAQMDRIERLHESGAVRKGVSFEPLVGSVQADKHRNLFPGLDLAIIGGETAAKDKVRPMQIEHAREIVEVCVDEDVPVFFKQWGDVDEHGAYVRKKKAGRVLDGRMYDALPRGAADHLRRGVLLAEAERIRRRRR